MICRHGPQPAWVKTRRTLRPVKSRKETSVPATLGRVKSEAFLPGLRPLRPRRLGVVASSCSRRQRNSPSARSVPSSKKPRKRTATQSRAWDASPKAFSKDHSPVIDKTSTADPRYHEHAIPEGVQTERRGDAGPVRRLPGGKTSPAAFSTVLSSVASLSSLRSPTTRRPPPGNGPVLHP